MATLHHLYYQRSMSEESYGHSASSVASALLQGRSGTTLAPPVTAMSSEMEMFHRRMLIQNALRPTPNVHDPTYQLPPGPQPSPTHGLDLLSHVVVSSQQKQDSGETMLPSRAASPTVNGAESTMEDAQDSTPVGDDARRPLKKRKKMEKSESSRVAACKQRRRVHFSALPPRVTMPPCQVKLGAPQERWAPQILPFSPTQGVPPSEQKPVAQGESVVPGALDHEPPKRAEKPGSNPEPSSQTNMDDWGRDFCRFMLPVSSSSSRKHRPADSSSSAEQVLKQKEQGQLSNFLTSQAANEERRMQHETDSALNATCRPGRQEWMNQQRRAYQQLQQVRTSNEEAEDRQTEMYNAVQAQFRCNLLRMLGAKLE